MEWAEAVDISIQVTHNVGGIVLCNLNGQNILNGVKRLGEVDGMKPRCGGLQRV